MKKLKDIRTRFVLSNSKIENRINSVCNSVIVAFAGEYSGADIYTGGNHIILIRFIEKERFEEYYYNISPACIGVDTMYYPFDTSHFFSLDEHNRKLYLLELIYKSLYGFFKHFGFDTKNIEKAYLKAKKSDFYYSLDKVFNKNKTISLSLEYTRNYDIKLYRVVIEELLTGEKTYLKLCEKEFFIGIEHPELTVHDLLKMPMTIESTGWISDDEYCYNWGEEKYIVSVSKKQVRTDILRK